MPVSHCRYGVKRVGFILTIRADGSNGIAATILGGACQKRTLGRLDAGKLFAATSYKSDAIVTQAIRGADHDSDKPCCTGPMIVGRSECLFKLPSLISSDEENERGRTPRPGQLEQKKNRYA
jgi:hypothetical protein